MKVKNLFKDKVMMAWGGGKSEKSFISINVPIYHTVHRDVTSGILLVFFCKKNFYMAERRMDSAL